MRESRYESPTWGLRKTTTARVFILDSQAVPHSPFIHNKNQINEIWASSLILRPTNNNRRGALLLPWWIPYDSLHSRGQTDIPEYSSCLLTDCIQGSYRPLYPRLAPLLSNHLRMIQSGESAATHNNKIRQWTLSHHRCLIHNH